MEEDRGLEGEGDIGVGIAAFDGDIVGRRVGAVAVQRQGAAVVGGEDELGLDSEGGGEGEVGDDAVVGFLDGDVAVALGGGVIVAEADEVVRRVGGGLDGDRGAVVYIICIRSAGSGDVALADAGGVADKVTSIDDKTNDTAFRDTVVIDAAV